MCQNESAKAIQLERGGGQWTPLSVYQCLSWDWFGEISKDQIVRFLLFYKINNHWKGQWVGMCESVLNKSL